jgi:hypothetical protein
MNAESSRKQWVLGFKKNYIWGFRVVLGAESRVCYPRNTTEGKGNHNGRSHTATSNSQQQIRMKSWFAATAVIWTCNLHYASAAPWLLSQVPFLRFYCECCACC